MKPTTKNSNQLCQPVITASALKGLEAVQWKFSPKDENNRQCNYCLGCHPHFNSAEIVGHKINCPIAEAIDALGGKAIYEQPNTSEEYRKANEYLARVIKESRVVELYERQFELERNKATKSPTLRPASAQPA